MDVVGQSIVEEAVQTDAYPCLELNLYFSPLGHWHILLNRPPKTIAFLNDLLPDDLGLNRHSGLIYVLYFLISDGQFGQRCAAWIASVQREADQRDSYRVEDLLP